MAENALSIIIPTARYSPILVKILKYLRGTLSNESIEVVIVSTSDNPGNRIYELLCKSTKNCKLLILERKVSGDSRSLQFNTGIYASKGPYVFITADDLVPTPKLMRSIIEIANKGDCDAILHAMIPLPVSLWAKVRMIEKIYSSFNLHQSSCRIMKRELFIRLGGYRGDLVLGEDIEFQQRLLKSKPKICVIPPSKGFELHCGEYKTFKEYIRRAWYYGRYASPLFQQINPLAIYKAYARTPMRLISSLRLLVFAYLVYKGVSLTCIVLRSSLTLISKLLHIH